MGLCYATGLISFVFPLFRRRKIDDYRPRLYLISPPTIELDIFATAFKQALSGGDIACFQLRLKDQSDEIIKKATERLMPLAQAHDVAFLLNDSPLLASELGVDGVHIGQEDMSYKETRALVGEEAIVGVTCHDSRHLAMEAAERGANYVAFGAFYPTSTKETKTRATTDILEWCNDLIETPCVAIGGITVDNAAPLIKSGADFLAVSGGVWNNSNGPEQAVTEFNRVIDTVSAT
ncbi:MAG: thiamine phosphate synthase [Sneathiella sp.]|nr:thiamine phosphate synthase [Sneathiella sp.]